MSNLSEFNISISGGLIEWVDYINVISNFLFFPAFLFLIFTIVMILNRSNIFLGFSLASLLCFLFSLIFYSLFTTFPFHLLLLSMALSLAAILFNLLWG